MLGEEIRKYRRRRKLTLSDLAAIVGVHESTVSRWECNLLEPSARNLTRIERALRVRIGFFATRCLQ